MGEREGWDGEEEGARVRGLSKTEGHRSETPVRTIEGESEVRVHGRMEGEGEKTIAEVKLGVPTTWPGIADCTVNVFVVEGLMRDEVIHVAREVDAHSRFLAWLDHNM